MRDKKIDQISIVSGKGGTGKTSFVAAFASMQQNLILADCDVDAANLQWLVAGTQGGSKTETFLSGYKAVVDPDYCIGCGKCLQVCRFHAVEITLGPDLEWDDSACIVELACEGCGCCVDECPAGSISLREKVAGVLSVSLSRFGTLVHAQLHPGEGSSGKLVTRVREKAQEIAKREDAGLILIDGSPGIGCPVIASISGTDGVLIVTEPTVSGLHDLIRVVDLCAHFKAPTYVAINKCDINNEMADRIRDHCRDKGIEVLGSVPFDPVFVHALTAGATVMEYDDSEVALNLKQIWAALLGSVRRSNHGVSKAAAN